MDRHSFHTFRDIRPAYSPSARTTNSSDSGNPLISLQKRRRKRPVAQACLQCRKAKTKCDGQRPICVTCHSRGRTCSYDDEGRQSPAAIARLEALERLVSGLQQGSLDQANSILQHIRTTDDLVAAISTPTTTASDLGSADSQQQSSQECQSKSPNELVPISSSSSSESLSNPPVKLFEREWGQETVSMTREHGQLQDCTDISEANTREDSSGTGCSTSLIQHQLPDAFVTKQAADAFFYCSGRLFHVFSRQQVAQYHSAVFSLQDGSADSSKLSVCSLMAVASVGAQYVCGTFGKESEEGFYNIAKHYLDVVMEHQPLDAIKVCTLMALYNIMNKSTVSLAYVEIGLGICRRYGLNSRYSRPSYLSDSEWIDYRRAWRTLIFISSWLSSTLGYISGNEIVVDRAVLSEVDIENPRQLSDVVQTEITKICLLKANILRMNLASEELTASDMRSVLHEMQNWYSDLPDQMKLNRAGQDLPLETKRSILHVHLLYLGSTMLLYSRIASQFVRPLETDNILPVSLKALVTAVSGEAILAASTSARLLKLLQEENSVYKRCWLVIFQAHRACIMMLHSAAQKQLHGFGSLALDEDIRHAKDCLSILSFCGSEDYVAAKFHEQLTAIMERVLMQEQNRQSAANPSPRCTDDEEPQQEDFRYLLTLPVHADTMCMNTSFSLLRMLCRPFGDSPSRPCPEVDVKKDRRLPPAQNDCQIVMERLRCDVESGAPFHWDLSFPLPGVVNEDGDAALSANSDDFDSLGDPPRIRFLGSSEPSGWSAAMDLGMKGD